MVRKCYACSKIIFCEPEANTGHPAPPSTPNCLCVCARNRQILVCDEQYANHPQIVQCSRFAVPFTHTRIWFANCLVRMGVPKQTIVALLLLVQMKHCDMLALHIVFANTFDLLVWTWLKTYSYIHV